VVKLTIELKEVKVPEVPPAVTVEFTKITAFGNGMGKVAPALFAAVPKDEVCPHCSIKYPVGLFGSGYFFQPLLPSELENLLGNKLLTNAVVATSVLLSAVAGVGAVGVPVSAGEASGAAPVIPDPDSGPAAAAADSN
jgi:hypothetical protein